MAGTLYPGNASVGQVLNSQVFSAGTNYDVPGTMPNQGAVTITPSSANQAIPAGYHSGAGVVNAVTFDATKVLTGTTIAGTAGTMSNFGSPTWTPGTASQSLSAGYYSGGTVAGDANLVSGNIKSGVSIFGVAGSSSVVDTTVSNGATASQILSGQKAYVNGALVTGTIPSVAGGNTITPGTASQTAIASATYATSAITVAGDVNLVSANIRAGSSIFGVAGATNVVDTTLATGGATAGQILSGQMGFVNGAKVTGTIPSVAGGNTITPGTASITAINAGTYATSAITVAGDANLVSANIKAGKSIFGVAGATNVVDTTYQTSGTGNVAVSASKMLTGFTAFVNGASVAGSVPIVAGGNTITPSTGAQTAIGAGTYATSAVTVAGDTNLVSANIKAGTSIFGVAGATNVVDTTLSTGGATAGQILSGQMGFVNGAKVTGTIPSVAGGNTITPGTASQTAINAGTYATNAITVAGDANLVSGNIKAGTSIFGVAGATNVVDTTLSTGGATAGQILSGQSGFVNGAKVTGTIPSVAGGTTTPTTANQTIINSGSYVTSNVVVAGDANLVAGNIKPGVSIFGVTSNMPSQSATTITPSTASQTGIPAGTYASGAVTVAGDANLVTGNIKSGVSIFGVAGKSSVVDTASANATASQILSGQTAYVNGSLVTGSIPSVAGGNTITPGTASQTAINAGTYATSTITVAGDPDLVPANIVNGVNIFGVTGSANVPLTSYTGTYTVTANHSVAVGDVVDIMPNGTVQKTNQTTTTIGGISAVTGLSGLNAVHMCKVDVNRFSFAYQASTTVYVNVGTVSEDRTGMTIGTPVSIGSPGSYSYLSCVCVGNNTVVVLAFNYSGTTYAVCAVTLGTGNTVASVGSWLTYTCDTTNMGNISLDEPNFGSNSCCIAGCGNGQAVVVFRDGSGNHYAWYQTLSVSGTTITLNTPVQVRSDVQTVKVYSANNNSPELFITTDSYSSNSGYHTDTINRFYLHPDGTLSSPESNPVWSNTSSSNYTSAYPLNETLGIMSFGTSSGYIQGFQWDTNTWNTFGSSVSSGFTGLVERAGQYGGIAFYNSLSGSTYYQYWYPETVDPKTGAIKQGSGYNFTNYPSSGYSYWALLNFEDNFFIWCAFQNNGTSFNINVAYIDPSSYAMTYGSYMHAQNPIGVALTAGSNDQSVNVQLGGIVGGFSGLAIGASYYVTTAGALTVTVGSNKYVGIALSASTILLDMGLQPASVSATFTTSGTCTVGKIVQLNSDGTISDFQATGKPLGIYIGNGVVQLKGQVNGLTGIQQGKNYFQRSGVISTDPFGIYIGIGLSSTSLYIDDYIL